MNNNNSDNGNENSEVFLTDLSESKYVTRDLDNLKHDIEILKDALGNFNMRILENKEHVRAIDKRTKIFVPRRTND